MKNYLLLMAIGLALTPLTSCAKENVSPPFEDHCSSVILDEYTGSTYTVALQGTWIGDYTVTNSICYDDRESFTDTFTLVAWSGTFLKMTATDTSTMTLYSDAFHFDDDPDNNIWNVRYVNDSALCYSSTISGNQIIRHYRRE